VEAEAERRVGVSLSQEVKLKRPRKQGTTGNRRAEAARYADCRGAPRADGGRSSAAARRPRSRVRCCAAGSEAGVGGVEREEKIPPTGSSKYSNDS